MDFETNSMILSFILNYQLPYSYQLHTQFVIILQRLFDISFNGCYIQVFKAELLPPRIEVSSSKNKLFNDPTGKFLFVSLEGL